MDEATKADEIAAELEEAILFGTIPPGTVLRQDQLAAQLGVSRTPVREALSRLDALGLVSVRPNRGALVEHVSGEDLRESFRVRAVLEGLAAELAATRMTAAELDDLRAAERAFADVTATLRQETHGEAERRRLTTEWLRANDAFHDLVLAGSGSPLLMRMARSVRRVFGTQPIWAPTPETEELFESNLRQHAALCEVLSARAPDAASELMRQHILDTGELLTRILPAVEGRAARRRRERG